MALQELMSLPAKKHFNRLRMIKRMNFYKKRLCYFASFLPSGSNSFQYLDIQNLAGSIHPLALTVIKRNRH
jgi:hypothetical protein